MQDNPEKFSEIVKHFRTRAGLTVEKVAEQADITERYLYRIENEDKTPSFDVLGRLVRTLSIPGDYIFTPKKRCHMIQMWRRSSICFTGVTNAL